MTSFSYWASLLPDGWFMCALCYDSHPITEASRNADGDRVDVCIPCAEREREAVARKRAAGEAS